MWSIEHETNLHNEIERNQSAFKENAQVIRNVMAQAALNIGNSRNELNKAKTRIQTTIQNAKRNVAQTEQAIESLSKSAETMQTNIKDIRTNVSELRNQTTQVRKIRALRKEQAESLQKKEEGNYHSSWMGLWRPLADGSQMGLIIASVVFSILGILCVVYLFLNRVPAVETKVATNTFSFIGGFFRRM